MRIVGIDPSTKLGFVALDINGKVLVAKELYGIGDVDPMRMSTLVDEVKDYLKPDDLVCIEGYAMNFNPKMSNSITFQAELGGSLRVMMYRKLRTMYEVAAPEELKKFVGVTKWIGEKGSKTMLKSKDVKKLMQQAVTEKYGEEFKSDNVNDAFILAMIAKERFETLSRFYEDVNS